jgi:hypothetical protein
MRIEFQYSFDEWLEWKRANLRPSKLIFLRIAEASLMPLSLLCALSLTLAFLQYLGVAKIVVPHISALVLLVLLLLLASAHIYLSTIPDLRKRALKQDWKQWVTQANYRLEITEEGINSNSTDPSCKTGWDEYSNVFQTKRLLMFCEGDGPDLLIIPKRAFGSKQRLEEFLGLAYRKTVSERKDPDTSTSV